MDAVVVGGDIAIGPMPRESLERLVALGDRALFVRGNGDREVAAPPATQDDLWAERTRWSAEQLSREQRAGWRRCRTPRPWPSTGLARFSSVTARREATRRS